MANINLTRSANVNYEAVAGDTFVTTPVVFLIDEVAEDFTGATFKMQIKLNNRVVRTLTDTDGITVVDNTLTYTTEPLTKGVYNYDVQKTVSGVVTTIQHGIIAVTNEVTT